MSANPHAVQHISPRDEKLKTLIENLSSYIEYYHGGWVKLVAIEENRVKVQMGGACEGCHLSTITLGGWVSGTIKQFFPEIEEVSAV